MTGKLFNRILTSFILAALLAPSSYAAGNLGGSSEQLAARRIKPSAYQRTDDDMVVTFIDVGQGNAVLVEAPSGKVLLYDGGGTPEWMQSNWDPGMEIVVPFLEEKGISRIDYIVISHAHEDHIGGLRAVLYNFEVGEFIDPGFQGSGTTYRTLLETVESRDIAFRILREDAGSQIDLGEGVKCEIFSPPADFYFQGTNSDINNNSLLLKITYGEVSFLLTGDIEERGESYAARKYRGQLASNILQVSHHGSATSSTRLFLEQVLPEVAVIPVGRRNTYGHPRPEALNNLERAGAEIYRTDFDGHVTVYTDGKTFTVETAQQ